MEPTLSKDIWFSKFEQLDMQSISAIQAYTVHSLLLEQKYQLLICLSRNFCSATSHRFSQNMLPFTCHAKKIKFKLAKVLTDAKKDALVKRTEEFEQWQAKNKKRKNRQMLLTGEIPQEQIDFEADSAELQRQIQLLQVKQDGVKIRKQAAKKVLKELNRDANQACMELEVCRKLLAKYGLEEERLNCEE